MYFIAFHAWHLSNESPESLGVSADLGDQFNFNACAHGQLRYAKGAAGVGANLGAKNLPQQLATAVGDQVMLCEVGAGIDQTHDFDDALYFV